MNTLLFLQRRLLYGGVIALGLLPLVLLTYAIFTERIAIIQDSDVNHSGSLRYRSLWIYGATQTAIAEQWQPQLMQMETLRVDLAKRYPEAVAQTDTEWNAFSHSLITTGRVDWKTANRMREVADTLTTAIERYAYQRHRQSERLFYFGITTMLFSIGAGIWLVRLKNRQEAKQRTAEERFRVLFEHSSDAHLLFDETGIVDCNNAAIQMLRCQDKAEVLALHPAVLSPEFQPDGRHSMEKCIEMDATAQKNGCHRFEWLHQKTDGEVFPVEVTLTPVKIANKDTLLVVWHDLTERKQVEDRVRQSERRFREMVENLPAGAIFIDGDAIFLNRAVEEMTGYAREELPTLDIWFQTIYQERAAEVRALYERNKAANFPASPIVPILHKDGSVRQVEFAAFGYESGEIWLLRDMTEHISAGQALKDSEMRLAEAQSIAHLGSYEYNIVTGEIVWSEETFHLFDRDPVLGPPTQEELLGLFHPEDSQQLLTSRLQAFQDGLPYANELRIRQKDGSHRWCRSMAKPVKDEAGTPLRLVGTVMDIHERKMAQNQLEAVNEWLAEANQELEAQKRALEKANIKLKALATTDGLTGIANHRAFQEALSEEWEWCQRYSQSLAVILIDVDMFKLFNDTFGHPEGDTVLKIVAQLLNETARETDFVARYGGEEFVVLLSEMDSQGACEVAERFRLAIEEYDWTLRPVTASFGVATLTPLTRSAQELIDGADKALYISKQNGRNCVTHFAASGSIPHISSIAA